MRKAKTVGVFFVLVALLAFGAVSVLANGQEEATTGILGDEVVTHAASHFVSADGDTAGAEITASGEVDDLGEVSVTASASWDWDLFSAAHPCALLNKVPVILDHDFVPGPGPAAIPWTADATVTITTEEGDKIFGAIVGGSVCELEVFGFALTINEGLTSFDITGGTGEFADASGSGLTRTVVDSRPDGGFIISEIFLHLEEDDEDDDD